MVFLRLKQVEDQLTNEISYIKKIIGSIQNSDYCKCNNMKNFVLEDWRIKMEFKLNQVCLCDKVFKYVRYRMAYQTLYDYVQFVRNNFNTSNDI